MFPNGVPWGAEDFSENVFECSRQDVSRSHQLRPSFRRSTYMTATAPCLLIEHVAGSVSSGKGRGKGALEAFASTEFFESFLCVRFPEESGHKPVLEARSPEGERRRSPRVQGISATGDAEATGKADTAGKGAGKARHDPNDCTSTCISHCKSLQSARYSAGRIAACSGSSVCTDLHEGNACFSRPVSLLTTTGELVCYR